MKWTPTTIVVTIAVALVVLYGGYKLVHHFTKAPVVQQSTQSTITPSVTQTNNAPTNNIYMTKTDSSKGTYLTDFQGMTLYTYSKDKPGVSNCTGTCATNWPPYTSGATAQSQFPADITVITRSDGSKQFAWKGMPLYYFASDTKAGQITGDGVGGFSLAK